MNTKRFAEIFILPVLYLAVVGLLAYAAAMASWDDMGDMDGPARAGVATTPPWQPVSVTGGACSDIVKPSEVGR